MFGDTRSIVNDMQAVGCVRVSTERQADHIDQCQKALQSRPVQALGGLAAINDYINQQLRLKSWGAIPGTPAANA
jgi:hypothetical protein